MNIQETEAASAAIATHPRVSLSDIEKSIAAEYHIVADHAMRALGFPERPQDGLDKLSICILVMKNGFSVIGKSAPASPENFNRELGKQFAYEDAIRQLWPLMGFSLRNKLSGVA